MRESVEPFIRAISSPSAAQPVFAVMLLKALNGVDLGLVRGAFNISDSLRSKTIVRLGIA